MSLFDFLFGKKEKMQQVPTITGGQSSLLDMLTKQLGGPISQGIGSLSSLASGSPESLEAFRAPLMRQFNEQIVPSLAERFTGMGAGAQNSSAFGQQLAGAGTRLSEGLSSQKSQLQQQALSQLFGLLSPALGTRSFENVLRPGTSGFLGSMMPGLSQGLGTGLGQGFGNWMSEGSGGGTNQPDLMSILAKLAPLLLA